MKKCHLLVLTLALVLTLGLLPAAAADDYPDLPESHWAFADMHEAVQRSILRGMGDGRMEPDGTLTWAQALTLVARALAPQAYNDPANDPGDWKLLAYRACRAADILLAPEEEFLPVGPDEDALSAPITRQDMVVLLARALPKEIDGILTDYVTAANTFADYAQLPQTHQQAVERLFVLGILKGSVETDADGATGRFLNGTDTLRRCDGTVLLMRTLELEEAWEKALRAESEEETYQAESGEENDDRYELGETLYKHDLLFGDADKRRYANQDEAEAHQTTVTVPVRQINKKGEKYASTVTFFINAAIADDVTAIFTEIFNDPEQFPMESVGGYNWRGDTATGEHNCGTAIDINYMENYQVRDGQAMVGTHWTPGEDPYSIPADGSVVRIFEKYGWSWGGDAWAGDSDPATGYHDYMHFSYMGG